MRIMIGAGGTGGHVYPALATAEALLNSDNTNHTLYFVGAVGGMERKLVAESGLDFARYDEVYAGPIHGVSPLQMMTSAIKLAIGTIQSFGKLLSSRPQVILLTGGWANLPVAIVAWLMRIPSVIYLPDIEPGLTIKVLQRFASKVAITVDSSEQYFSAGKTVITGYPLQKNRLTADYDEAVAHFKLDLSRKTLLVFGGSRGAQNINIALGDCLVQLLDDDLQVLHVTGTLDYDRMMEQIGDIKDHPQYHPFAYLHGDMGLAFAASDLVICRSGASTLAELPLFGLASILVPYPYAWRYQKVNADYLTDKGAGIRLNDEDMSAQLYDTIKTLTTDANQLSEMQAKSKLLANPDGAKRLAHLLIEVGGA